MATLCMYLSSEHIFICFHGRIREVLDYPHCATETAQLRWDLNPHTRTQTQPKPRLGLEPTADSKPARTYCLLFFIYLLNIYLFGCTGP